MFPFCLQLQPSSRKNYIPSKGARCKYVLEEDIGFENRNIHKYDFMTFSQAALIKQ